VKYTCESNNSGVKKIEVKSEQTTETSKMNLCGSQIKERLIKDPKINIKPCDSL